jgi:putative heme degradation protein
VPHGVLGDAARDQELQQIVRSAGLGAAAGELEAAEGLAIHKRARDLAVDVQVADAELAANTCGPTK